jgi:hypothetical protein
MWWLCRAIQVNVVVMLLSVVCDQQCHLNEHGTSDLVVDLIISNHSSRIFQEAIDLAIALLDGGNSVIQVLHVVQSNCCLKLQFAIKIVNVLFSIESFCFVL